MQISPFSGVRINVISPDFRDIFHIPSSESRRITNFRKTIYTVMVTDAFICRNPKGFKANRLLTDKDYCIFILALNDGIACQVDGKEMNCGSGITLLPPPHHRSIASIENLKGYILGVRWDQISEIPQWSDMEFLSNIFSAPHRDVSQKDMKLISKYFGLFSETLKNIDDKFGQLALEHMTKAITILCRLYFPNGWNDENTVRIQEIAHSFLKLVSENVETERGITFYADKLCVTPKYLSDAIAKATGKKAMKWIEEFIIMRAKELLGSTDLSVTNISRQLNFYTPSDFCRYFRKNTGTSPKQYRSSCGAAPIATN